MDEVLVLEQVLDEQQALAALKTLGGSNGVASQYGSRLRPHRSGSHLCAATVRGAVSMGDTSTRVSTEHRWFVFKSVVSRLSANAPNAG